MSAQEYYRLMKGNRVIGFKRVTTEYLPVNGQKWQLEEIEHNHFEEQRLSKYPKGINKYPAAMNWPEAVKHLNEIKSKLLIQENDEQKKTWQLGKVRHLEARFDNGERSSQLYNEIMQLR